MILYEEEHSEEETIDATTKQDIQKGSDAILVIEMTLKASEAKKLMRELCRAVKTRDGLTI